MYEYVQEICKAISLTLPLLVPGVALIIILKLGLLKVLGIPLDLGLFIRGKRIFGENKTYKGIFVMFAVAIIVTYSLYFAYTNGYSQIIDPIFMETPLHVGALYAISYVIGELINSFIKRQLDIPEGIVVPFFRGKVQTFFDLSDGIIVTVIMLSISTSVSTTRLMMACCLGFIFHFCTDLWMRRLRLKK